MLWEELFKETLVWKPMKNWLWSGAVYDKSGIILHQETVGENVDELATELLPYSPYSPDPFICDFWACPTMNGSLWKQRFGSIEGLDIAVKNNYGKYHVMAYVTCSARGLKDGKSAEKGRYFEKKWRLNAQIHIIMRMCKDSPSIHSILSNDSFNGQRRP